MNRVLVWNAFRCDGDEYAIGPAYYLEGDYVPVGVRLYAEVSPGVEDAEFDIYDDGSSIFADKASHTYYYDGGTVPSARATSDTTVSLHVGDTEEVDAENFQDEFFLEQGSWITCRFVKDGGGKNFTVLLELKPMSEGSETED